MSIWDFFTGNKKSNQSSESSQTANRNTATQGTQNQSQTSQTTGSQSTQGSQLAQTQQQSATAQDGRSTTTTTQTRSGRQDTQTLSDQTIAELQGITALLGDLTQQGAGSQGIAGDVVDTILKNASTAKGDVLASVAAALEQAKLNYKRGTGTAVLDRANQIGSRGNTAFMEVNNRGEAELATQLATVSTQGAVLAREQELKELTAGLQGAQTNASLNLQTANAAAIVANAEKGGKTSTTYSETLQSVADTISSLTQQSTGVSSTATNTSQNTQTAGLVNASGTTTTSQQVADIIESLTSNNASGGSNATILDWLNVFK